MTRGSKPKKKLGRPSKNLPDYYPKKVYSLALLGLTDKEIGDVLDIKEKTFQSWKRKYEALRVKLHEGRIGSLEKVADSLYHKAIGYSHPETKVFMYQGKIITKEVIKHYPPDTGAACFILKNKTRSLEEPWKDAHEHEVSGPGGKPLQLQHQELDLTGLTDEQKELLFKVAKNTITKKVETEETEEK